MTERERILAVYDGRTPDRVPFMLDLSHYYYEKTKTDWDLCRGYAAPEKPLIDYNRACGAGFYMPNQAVFLATAYSSDVRAATERRVVDGRTEIVWRYETPLGSIERIRVFEPTSYSWAIKKLGVTNGRELEILGYALSSRTFTPLVENYAAWDDYVGDNGLVYIPAGYSAIGQLYHYWMGVAETVYATMDMEDTLHAVVDQINQNNLEMLRAVGELPGRVVLLGDNFSSDMQPPSFFNVWSRPYYEAAIDLLHNAGKKVAVHIDGKLKHAISMIRDCGADAIDAVTPGSVGGYTPSECREEAGDSLILSGGIPNELWLPFSEEQAFVEAVKDWLKLKARSAALISAAGDQVPPGAMPERIALMHALIEEYGRY